MVVYNKLTINSVDYTDAINIDVESNIGEYNGVSNFSAVFNNQSGKYDDTFSLNEDVLIYAEKDVNPPTIKIFRGIIEDISFKGNSNKEKLTISGRDYGAVLQDMTIQPVVFKNRDCGEVAKIIIEQNAQGVVTSNNVEVNTGVVLERITFNQKNIFDALKQLAELSGYYFYVDEDKDVNFVVKAGTSSGITFDNSNITDAIFKTNDSEIFNKIWVYGDRILTGTTDISGIGGGSVFTLTDKPHNISVFVGSVLQQPGGVINLTDPTTTSGLKYVVDFNERQIVFVSGVSAGDNIPASGTSNIQVDYDRSTPILKFIQDDTSILTYGPKTKVITNKNIKDFSEANDIATSTLAEYKDPKIQGDIEVYGVVNVTPGDTCIVNVPFHNINNQTYTILSASYSFNINNNLSDSVLSLKLNKKIVDFTDTLKEQMLKIKNFETGQLEGVLTRLETATGSVGIRSHYELWGGNVGSNFVFHSERHGKFNDTNSRLAFSDAGSSLLISGGDF